MIELSFPLVLLCLAAGILLLALEVFVTPGLGIKGLLGLLLIGGAVALAFLQHGMERGVLVLAMAIVVMVAGGWAAKVTVGRRLVLNAHVPSDRTVEIDLAGLVGRDGEAVSALRPSGIARFGEQRLDVTCESEFVEAGTPVVVESVLGNKILVRRKGA